MTFPLTHELRALMPHPVSKTRPPPAPCSPQEEARRHFVTTLLGLLALPEGALAATAPKARPRIAFFTPNSEGNTYWPQVFRIMGFVAQSLGFEFVPYSFGVQNRFARLRDAVQSLSAQPRPDAVIASVVIGQSHGILEAARAMDIPVFILGPLFPAELPTLGGAPRVQYQNWPALFNWAEAQKGHALAKVLLQAAQRQNAVADDGRLHVVGLGGDPSWFGSGLREAGLRRAVAEHPNAVLKQVVPTHWRQSEGQQLTARLLARFPQASVFWAASDQLGSGAVQALTAAGKVPGKTAFTGGLDLSELGLDMVSQGQFVATAASPLMSYAQVAILVYDYLQGRDFEAELGREIEFPTLVATRDNAAQHQRLGRCVHGIDFKAFSKAHNPRLSRYDFSFEAFLTAAGVCARA
ncbi:ABC transporter substrate-binding protein [Aquabacterium sp.]|uniref:ABC transporter substrate-binding protein n=1 Tax=Aquabacterium sp. TaxID=1872578 RepID=UPI002488276E|nr:ABC transporter substrate-binding protein [Aquabacterium sp.]MDI1261249.1 ABC transporter substrate-binding protein [Aquabacterium sp.]